MDAYGPCFSASNPEPAPMIFLRWCGAHGRRRAARAWSRTAGSRVAVLAQGALEQRVT